MNKMANKKNVKKNTWLRKIKAFDLRMDRQQRNGRVEPVDDETVRVCVNCGKEFTGRFCPQCGQDASWNRFSWKQEAHNMLGYLGVCKDALSKTLKKNIKRKPKKVKPIKKNTMKRKIKVLDLRLDRRQQMGHAPKPADQTIRTCTNCGEEYTGRFCPQCGQSGVWDRYSWRRVVLNFLDIWGLGNRPMFRTVMELFWRPGYMVRDYLFGHRQLYFPPFKLLAVTMALTLFVNMLTGNEFDSVLGSLLDNIHIEKMNLSPTLTTVSQALVDFGQFLVEHPLYEVLFLILFMVCCVRVAFRRVGTYNFVETFIFMVFLICQIYICDLFSVPITSLYSIAEDYLLSSSSSVVKGIGGLVSSVAALISWVFGIFMAFLYVFDFHQFYGLSWKNTIQRLLFAVFVALMVLCVIVFIASITYKYGIVWGGCLLVLSIVVFGTYAIASDYLHKSKPQVSGFIYYLSKWLSYSLLVSTPIVAYIAGRKESGGANIWIVSLVTLACCVLSGLIAFLPSYLNKRNRNHQ